MTQQALLTVEVPLSEVGRKPSLGKAIEYCAELAGYAYDKELERALEQCGVKVDATQLTRWKQGAEGIRWEKLAALMDVCGNDAPVLWMLHQRGWDLSSLRKRETETERLLRLSEERVRTMEAERVVERRLLAEVLTGRRA